MANTKISNAAAIDACDAVVDRLDGGTGAGVIKIYAGAQPADPDTAVGTQQAEETLSATGTAVSTLSIITQTGTVTVSLWAKQKAAQAVWTEQEEADGTWTEQTSSNVTWNDA